MKEYGSSDRIVARSKPAVEHLLVKSGMAFTIEPRPKVVADPSIPMVSYHCICAIDESGKKELITGFGEIFDLIGMDCMR